MTSPYSPSPTPSAPQGYGTTALVLGIVSIVGAFLLAIVGWVAGIIGLIFGILYVKGGGKKTGLILSIIGLVLSLISSILGVVLLSNA